MASDYSMGNKTQLGGKHLSSEWDRSSRLHHLCLLAARCRASDRPEQRRPVQSIHLVGL